MRKSYIELFIDRLESLVNIGHFHIKLRTNIISNETLAFISYNYCIDCTMYNLSLCYHIDDIAYNEDNTVNEIIAKCKDDILYRLFN